MTSDHFSQISSLESALAEEKASHTDTLVKLRLMEERLASSEAERLRLVEISQLRKRDSIEAEQALYRVHMLVTGKNTVPGNYAECEREIVEAVSEPPSEFLRNVDCGDVFDRDENGNPIDDDDAPTEPAAEKEAT